MINKRQYACVSQKAIEEGHIGFGYRAKSNSADDTGWRLMRSKDEDRLDLANPDKVFTCGIGKLLTYFPELTELIKSGKTGSVWEEEGEKLVQKARVKEFTEDVVPNLMVGNIKFTATPGVGVMMSSDPKSFHMGKRMGKEEWEQMLPEEKQLLAEK